MQWHKTDYGAQRLELEQNLVYMDFPSMDFVECEDGNIRVSGSIGAGNLCLNSYLVVAQYPSNYPNNRIKVWAPEESFPSSTPHRYPNGELCVEHDDFNADDTMSTVLSWTIQWLVLYEEFRNTGKRW